MAGVSWRTASRGAQAFLRAQIAVGIIVDGGWIVVVQGARGRGISACCSEPVWCLSQEAPVTRIWDWMAEARGHGEVGSLKWGATGRWDSSRETGIQK